MVKSLLRKAYAPGVYAALSDDMSVSNCGFVIGRDAMVVIGTLANQEHVAQLKAVIAHQTRRPIDYLINTCTGDDHWLKNALFGPETVIVTHPDAVCSKPLLKQPQLEMIDHQLTLSLGGLTVIVSYFGKGVMNGQLLAYVPEYKILFSGCMILGEPMLVLLHDSDIDSYCSTLEKINQRWEVYRVITGRGQPVDGWVVKAHIDYLYLLKTLREDMSAGYSSDRLMRHSKRQLMSIFAPYCNCDPHQQLFKTHHANLTVIEKSLVAQRLLLSTAS